MKIVFCCYDFKKENLRLMPWRYIYEISKVFVQRGHDISVLSVDKVGELKKDSIDGINIFPAKTNTLFSGRSSQKLFGSADIVVWSSSPLTVFFNKKLKAINKPLILLFTGPLYTISEVKKAQSLKVPFKQLTSHYKNAAVPLKLTSDLINADFVRKAIVLSEKNANILRNKGTAATKITVVPPGYDGDRLGNLNDKSMADIRKVIGLPENRKILTYLGSLYQIRGINMLLDAFRGACKKSNDLMLLILARTDKEKEVESLCRQIRMLDIAEKTLIIPGFIEKSKVMDYLFASDMVVLPFILVPSDMPLGALEAMALGKPVIATDVDGMPEMVKDRGIIVKPGDRDALAKAIISLSQDSSLYSSLKANCVSYMSHYPTWEEVTNRFLSIIH